MRLVRLILCEGRVLDYLSGMFIYFRHNFFRCVRFKVLFSCASARKAALLQIAHARAFYDKTTVSSTQARMRPVYKLKTVFPNLII